MKQLYPDLWRTPQQATSSGLTFYAYLLTRPDGNVLVGNPRDSQDFDQIADLGGITHHYLTHCHEVHPSLKSVAERFHSRLCAHALVEPYLTDVIQGDVYFNTPQSEFHLGNIEVLNTPGHTNNNLCFRYRSPHGKTYLFVGDTIYWDNGGWNILIVPSDGGNEAELAKSLADLRELDVDAVLTSAGVGSTAETLVVSTDEWHDVIDSVLGRLSNT